VLPWWLVKVSKCTLLISKKFRVNSRHGNPHGKMMLRKRKSRLTMQLLTNNRNSITNRNRIYR
jgi:hypothetical protein